MHLCNGKVWIRHIHQYQEPLRTTPKLLSSRGRSSAPDRSNETFAILEFSGPSPGALNHFGWKYPLRPRVLRSGHFMLPKCHVVLCAAGNIQHMIAWTNCCKREHARLCGLELILPGLLKGIRSAVPAISLNAALKFRVHRESRNACGVSCALTAGASSTMRFRFWGRRKTSNHGQCASPSSRDPTDRFSGASLSILTR